MNNKQFCNLCGQELDFFDQQEDFSIHKNCLGYGTLHDGDTLNLKLCCGCMDKLVKECKLSPIMENTMGGE